jgi:hypothetical protein
MRSVPSFRCRCRDAGGVRCEFCCRWRCSSVPCRRRRHGGSRRKCSCHVCPTTIAANRCRRCLARSSAVVRTVISPNRSRRCRAIRPAVVRIRTVPSHYRRFRGICGAAARAGVGVNCGAETTRSHKRSLHRISQRVPGWEDYCPVWGCFMRTSSHCCVLSLPKWTSTGVCSCVRL